MQLVVLDRLDEVQTDVGRVETKVEGVEHSLDQRIDELDDAIDDRIDGLVERLVRVETALGNRPANQGQPTQQDTSASTTHDPVAND